MKRAISSTASVSPAVTATSRGSGRFSVGLHGHSPRMVVSIATAMIPFLERRRQPRPDGLQHAASGCASAAHREPHRGYRHGVQGRRGLRRVRAGRARRRGDQWVSANLVRVPRTTARSTTTSSSSLCAPTRAPASTRCPSSAWATVWRRTMSSPTAPPLRTAKSPGQERPHRLYDLGRLQLRGRRSAQRADRAQDVYTSIHIEEYEIEAATPSWGRRKSPGISPTSTRSF